MTTSQFFNTIITGAKDALIQSALPAIITFLTYVKANPTNFVGIALQEIVLKDALLTALPQLESSEIANLTGSLITSLQAQLTAAEKAASTPASAPVQPAKT